jgi:hypothetical protein
MDLAAPELPVRFAAFGPSVLFIHHICTQRQRASNRQRTLEAMKATSFASGRGTVLEQIIT